MQYLEKAKLVLESYDKEFDDIVNNSQYLYKLATGMVWVEGPAVLNGNVIFSDVKSNKMYSYFPEDGTTKIFREYSNYANGNYIDIDNNLVTCEHGRRCISKTTRDGSVHILVDTFEGKRFNSPNDLVVKSDGSIWFTDPPYGIISNEEGYKAESQIVGCYVYRFDSKTKEVQAIISDTQRPNGLAFSPCEKILYVADMSVVDFEKTGRRHIRAYSVNGMKVQYERDVAKIEPGIPDGFCVDDKGRLFVSFEHGIQVWFPNGKCIGKIMIPERVSNCTFSETALYITATSSLYCIEINRG